MSYIDTFDHEFIGFIAGLPIYHPLEIVAASDIPSEFGCSPQNLIIGGGDGEFPAIIVTDLEMAASHFMNIVLMNNEGEVLLPDRFLGILDKAWDSSKFLLFSGWNVTAFAKFHKRCKSPACQTPYNSNKFHSVESWLLGSIGELIYFSLRDICNNSIEAPSQLQKILQKPHFLNVTIPPPGSPLVWGRKRDSSGNIQWGVSHWSSF